MVVAVTWCQGPQQRGPLSRSLGCVGRGSSFAAGGALTARRLGSDLAAVQRKLKLHHEP